MGLGFRFSHREMEFSMSKEIEKSTKKRTVLVTLGTLAALVGLIKFIIRIANGEDTRWEN